MPCHRTSQQGNNAEHIVKTTQEWLQDKFLNVLEGPSQSLKIAVRRRCPSNLTELGMIFSKELEKLPKYRFANL